MGGINTLLINACYDLKHHGVRRFNERTGKTILELRNYIMVGNPHQRYINIPGRKNNFAAQLMEMMMVISGNPDLINLSKFLPRAVDYSDDGGKTWRGNYGIRLRGNKHEFENCDDYNFSPFDEDGIAAVIEEIKNDPTTRQGAVNVFDTQVDKGIKTKDTPCTIGMVFASDASNKLELTVFMRSNDVIFGWSGVNYFIFSCLQDLVASCVGMEAGNYVHVPVSFHIYEDYFKTLEDIIDPENEEIHEIDLGNLFEGFINLKEFDRYAGIYFSNYDNPEQSLTDFYELLKSYEGSNSTITRNYFLSKLLTLTKAYVNGGSYEEISSIVGGEEVILGLVRRDTFLTKKITNVPS